MELPSLYSIDAAGKVRVWSVKVDQASVVCKHGLATGKKVTSTRVFEAKNIGRKNETTAEKQASLEAEREWIKHLNKGYRVYTKKVHGAVEGVKENKKDLEMQARVLEHMAQQNNMGTGLEAILRGEAAPDKKMKVRTQTSENPAEYLRISPMLCSKWEDKPACKKYFSHPEGFYLQRKFDGVRVLAAMVNGEVVLWSRGGKNYPHLTAIKDSLRQIFDTLDEEVVFDGELYAHVIKGKQVVKGKKVDYVVGKAPLGDSERFDVIAGIGKPARTSPHPLEDQLEYHIFDLVDGGGKTPQNERFEHLDEIFETIESLEITNIKKVETILTKKESDIYKYHDIWAQDGYEGVIVRSYDNTYVGKRNLKIRKHKEFVDSEFEITGVELDPGVDEEFFVFTLKTENGDEFKAKPMGTRAARVAMYNDYESFVGQMATIRYQKLSKDGVPIFGRFIRVREEGV